MGGRRWEMEATGRHKRRLPPITYNPSPMTYFVRHAISTHTSKHVVWMWEHRQLEMRN